MTSEDQLISLRRRRGYCGGRFTYLSTRLDEYEQSGSQQNSLLTNYEKQLTEVASQFEAIQLELEVLDEKEQVRGFEIRDQYVAVDTRLQNLLRNAQTASPSTSINPPTCASSASLNPIVIKLPDLRLPTFGGSLEKWNTFYDTLSSQSTNDESAAGRESASLKLPENHFPGHNAKTPPSPLPQGPTDKGSNNDLNKTRNAIQTPPTEKIASTRTPTSPRVTRNSLHNTSSVSPTRDLTTTKFASSLSQQSDLTLPNALNQKTRPIRNSSYHTRNVSLKRGLTTTTLASSGTEQSESTLLITLNLTSFNEPLGLKKERVSPGDKSFQKLISHNLLQNVHDSLTAVHNLDSNGLNPIQDSKVNVESKPTGKASKSTVITPSRGSFSSGNTSTMDVQHNVSTSNHLSYITSSAPPETRNIASDSHTPRRNVKTPPSPPQRGAMPTAVPNESRITDISMESPVALKTPTYSPTPRQVTVTTSNGHSPPRIITKRMRFERVIGGSPASQSTSNLRTALDESSPSTTDVPFNDTSWAEVFNDTSRSKIHDTSWVVKFTWKSLGIDEEDGDLDYREDNVPSMHWPLGRVIKVHPGADGVIRTATVQTAKSVLDRAVKRLVPLPIQPDLEKPEQLATETN